MAETYRNLMYTNLMNGYLIIYHEMHLLKKRDRKWMEEDKSARCSIEIISDRHWAFNKTDVNLLIRGLNHHIFNVEKTSGWTIYILDPLIILSMLLWSISFKKKKNIAVRLSYAICVWLYSSVLIVACRVCLIGKKMPSPTFWSSLRLNPFHANVKKHSI